MLSAKKFQQKFVRQLFSNFKVSIFVGPISRFVNGGGPGGVKISEQPPINRTRLFDQTVTYSQFWWMKFFKRRVP